MKKVSASIASCFQKKIILLSIGIVSLLFVGISSYLLSHHQSLRTKHQITQQIAGVSTKQTPTPTEEQNISEETTPMVSHVVYVANSEIKVSLTPTPSKQQQTLDPTVTITSTPPAVQNANANLLTAPPTSPTPQSTVTPIVVSQTVSLQIQMPNGNTNVTVELTDGMNVCDVLTKAKSEGKIQSLTINDAYMSTLHSLYVYEMNGFTNNWTFTVNGTAPLGCSLSKPSNHDTIVWKYS